MNTVDREIKELLLSFQAAYQKRSLDDIDSFLRSMFIEEFPVYYGVSSREQRTGLEDIRELVECDWRYWGDLHIDIDRVTVHGEADFACCITTGFVDWKIPEETFLGRSLHGIQDLLEGDGSQRQKLLAISNNAIKVLMEADRGTSHVLPLRISCTMKKEDGAWKFCQLHFSHPTEMYPDSRML